MRGWSLVPIDAGNQIRRIGQQASIKFQWSSQALTQMKYKVGRLWARADMRLNVSVILLAVAVESADVRCRQHRIGRSFVLCRRIRSFSQAEWTVGVTSILDPENA